MCRAKTKAAASIALWVGIITNGPAVGKGAEHNAPFVDQSTPKLEVRVYSFAGVSAWTLAAAEEGTMSLLRPAGIVLAWMNCGAGPAATACMEANRADSLIVRILPKALPQVSASALGIADTSDRAAAAFVFYDRVLALRTHTRLAPAILGRVMAHEISHLLLPEEQHSSLGLMKGRWAADDLEIANCASLRLSAESVVFMQREALRRVLSVRR